MIEHVTVLRGLFADGLFDFAGEHYQITALDGSPKPYRRAARRSWSPAVAGGC